MEIAATRAREIHHPAHASSFTCPISGEWEVWSCPECAYEAQIRRRPFKRIVRVRSEAALTDEMVSESLRLRKEGKHDEADQIVASAPAHRFRLHGGLDAMSVEAR